MMHCQPESGHVREATAGQKTNKFLTAREWPETGNFQPEKKSNDALPVGQWPETGNRRRNQMMHCQPESGHVRETITNRQNK